MLLVGLGKLGSVQQTGPGKQAEVWMGGSALITEHRCSKAAFPADPVHKSPLWTYCSISFALEIASLLFI
jgi:hypothetical protein